jgi:5'-3' exonuclease
MPNIIDTDYWAWNTAFWIHKSEVPVEPFSMIHTLIGPGTVLAFDGVGSIRKDSLPWYKENRNNPDDLSMKLRTIAEKLLRELKTLYPHQSIELKGLEADDIIAMAAKSGSVVWSNDKDYLQLPQTVILTNFRNEFWGVERFKEPTMKITRGNAALAYQLMKGDTADNIPGLVKYDRPSMREVFESDNPLIAAIELINNLQKVRASLAALMLPTPLYSLKGDIIDIAIERYPV